MNSLFTIIYGWMWSELGLRGLTKEVFAVIYGFASRKKDTAISPYTVIQAITGASRSSISAAIKELEDRNLIECVRKEGRCTRYIVHLEAKYLKKMSSSPENGQPSSKTGGGSSVHRRERKEKEGEHINDKTSSVSSSHRNFKEVAAVQKINKEGGIR